MGRMSYLIGGLLLASAGPVAAQPQLGVLEGPYAQLNLGLGVAGDSHLKIETPNLPLSTARTDLKAGLGTSALVGVSYSSGVAVEFEGVYLRNNLDSDEIEGALNERVDIDTRIFGGFANVKYEYVNRSRLYPYVAAGLGFGQTEYKVMGDVGRSNGVLWQLKTGVSIPASSDVTWDLGYRYLRSPDYESTDQVMLGKRLYDARFKAATGVHVLSAGLRWNF